MLGKAAAVIEGGIKARLHIGAQLYVSRDGEAVADLAFGEARDGVPMRPDRLMLWMSSVKPITVVAIAQMWERGKLDRGLGVVIDSKQHCKAATWYGNRCSPRTWGHAGCFSSVGFVDPANRIVVALVFNGMLEAQENRHDTRMVTTLDAVDEDLGVA